MYSANIDYFSLGEHTKRYSYMLLNGFFFFLSAEQLCRSIVLRWRWGSEEEGWWRGGLSPSMWTLSWNEGLAAIATIWWSRQGYLKEFSCYSRSRQLHTGPAKDKEIDPRLSEPSYLMPGITAWWQNGENVTQGASKCRRTSLKQLKNTEIFCFVWLFVVVYNSSGCILQAPFEVFLINQL